MGRKRKREYTLDESRNGKTYENGRGRICSETFALLCESQFRSPAFMALNGRRQTLFICCKLQRFGKHRPGQDYPGIPELRGNDFFYLNRATVIDDYGLYPKGSEKNFYEDMKYLINHGLIDVFSEGKKRHLKNIYRYSTRWKTWDPSMDLPKKIRKKPSEESSS